MRSVQCPNCGNSQLFDDGKNDFIFCQYCGTKIDVADKRSIHKYIDEASIHKTDAELQLELKKLEMAQEAHKKHTKALVYALIGSLAALLITFLLYNRDKWNDIYQTFMLVFGSMSFCFLCLLIANSRETGIPEDPEVEKARIEAIERMSRK